MKAVQEILGSYHQLENLQEVWTVAVEHDTVTQHIPANHNPGFAPAMQPCSR